MGYILLEYDKYSFHFRLDRIEKIIAKIIFIFYKFHVPNSFYFYKMNLNKLLKYSEKYKIYIQICQKCIFVI